jgi:hypothetical protein
LVACEAGSWTLTDLRSFIGAKAQTLSFRSGRSISSEPPGSPAKRPAQTLFRFPPTRASTNVVFHNGWIASAVPVQLLFWGGWWKTDPEGSARKDALITAVQGLLDSPYLWELDQYRAAPATYRGALIVEDPAPPGAFSDGDAADLIWKLIDDGRFPETDESGGRIGYMIILPKATTHDPADCGAHAAATHTELGGDDLPAWWAWIGYDTVDGMASCFSHELVELMTSPELDGWHVDMVNPNASEIGDLCDVTNGWVNGVFVRAYWSNRDQRCVIPTEGRMLRIDGTIAGKQPRQVASGPYSPPVPKGVDKLLPACHLEGKTYIWTLSEVDETAELDATAEFFYSPGFEWTVAGVKLAPGSGRVPITVDVTRQAAGGSSTSSEEVSLAYQTSGSHLELSNDSVAGNMDVLVTVVAYDQAGAVRPENPMQASVTVSFQGSILSMPDYDQDIKRCQQAADGLWKATHKGFKHGPIGPLGEADRELLASQPGWVSARQLRRLKNALLQAEAIRGIDTTAGRALRKVLLDGLHVREIKRRD